ncbi:MAG: hypothetical protein K1X53_16690, partial [Candidatus Sumerlaeaceae bacterium]|nr:hypothetical protein [Candidatus Sumerlaeaceae bacterium]
MKQNSMILVAALALSGCAGMTPTQRGAAVGAVAGGTVGAIAGGAAAHVTAVEGAAVGAAIGGLAGALVGGKSYDQPRPVSVAPSQPVPRAEKSY